MAFGRMLPRCRRNVPNCRPRKRGSLADSGLSWLLVYDNVDEASILDQFVPSHGGHVIVTTRNQELASGWSSRTDA